MPGRGSRKLTGTEFTSSGLVNGDRATSALLRSDGGHQAPWLQVKAIAAGRNREGIGTKVTVTAAGIKQTGWIRTGSSYCSQSELTAFFGLGTAPQADTVELLFPSGAKQTLTGIKANQRIIVHEARGLVAQGPPGPVRQ